MRSLRLSLAEMFNISQKPILPRILVILPLIAVTAGLLFWSNKDGGSFEYLTGATVTSRAVTALTDRIAESFAKSKMAESVEEK